MIGPMLECGKVSVPYSQPGKCSLSFGGGGLRHDLAHCSPNGSHPDTARRSHILPGREAVPACVRGRGGMRTVGGGVANVRVQPSQGLADGRIRAIVLGVLQRSPRPSGYQVLGGHLARVL